MEWRELNMAYKDRLDELAQLRPAELLEVPESAAREDLRRAYLAKVKTYHPDLLTPSLRRILRRSSS